MQSKVSTELPRTVLPYCLDSVSTDQRLAHRYANTVVQMGPLQQMEDRVILTVSIAFLSLPLIPALVTVVFLWTLNLVRNAK